MVLFYACFFLTLLLIWPEILYYLEDIKQFKKESKELDDEYDSLFEDERY